MRWAKVVKAGIGVAALSLVTAAPAFATCPTSDSGRSMAGSTANTSGYADWDGPARHFALEALAAAGMSTSHCADAWFDWHFQNQDQRGKPPYTWVDVHHDARLARTCEPGSERWANNSSSGFTEANYDTATQKFRFLEPHRLGVCVTDGTAGGSNAFVSPYCNDQGCATQDIDGPIGSPVNPDMPNYTTEAWTKYQDGSIHHFSGGDPLDPHA
jgi:hypothetical protein